MIWTTAALRRAFTGACLAWAGALPAATVVAHLRPPRLSAAVFVVAVYSVGSVVCHQRPERSFHLWGQQLPVCARCTGIYAGAAMAVALVGIRRLRTSGATTRVQAPLAMSPLAAVLVASLPTAGTLVFEWTTGVTPANWVRAAAGLVVGATVAWVVARQLAAES